MIAHVSHWLVNVLYLVPLVIIVAMLGVTMVRDRRAEASEGSGGASLLDDALTGDDES